MKHAKLFESAVSMQLAGDWNGARTAYQKLLRDFPAHSEVLGNLAVLIKREGKFAAAEQLLQRSIRANPRNVAAMATLANIKLAEKKFDESLEITEKALEIEPDYPESILNQGVVLVHRNQLQKAEDAFRRVLSLSPTHIHARMNLANCHRLRKIHTEEALTMLQGIAKLQPDNAGVHMMLCYSYQDAYQFVNALESAKTAISLDRQEEYLIAYANILVVLGEFEEALDVYKEVIQINPENYVIGATFLFALNYDNRKTSAQVFKEYENFGARFGKGVSQFSHKNREKIGDRKIRVGYSSPDFYSHVVTLFIEPIFIHHDRSKFELFAYANVIKPDDRTTELKEHFDHWVDVFEMSDKEVAQRMYDDGIDIVIDLAGHTAGNRLQALAMKPAPVQITYLGFGYTTGMKEIDYFIGDENFTPEGCDAYFSEKVCRIPSPVYAYQPPRTPTPDVKELPALDKGYITFGSMSRIVRFNTSLLKVWKQILDRVPGSKLRLDQKPFDEEHTRERFTARLEKLGYQREQIELVSSKPHWIGYHEFDISLDCWPHNAGTTTFESLWMGVPVLSKRDRPSVGRLSDMVLRPLGLEDWVVDTEAEFVEKAVAFASDIPALVEMRKGMRPRLQESPFMDYESRTKGLEDAYVAMMQTFEGENP